MSACEKCWADAGGNMEHYMELLALRASNPCTPDQQKHGAANCDVCDKRPGVRRMTAYGSDTWVCEKCGGDE